jgi:AraC-like DNA-binding protein
VTVDSGVGGVASAALRSLAFARGSFDRHAARAVADQLAGLIALAVGAVQARPRSASRALLLQSALDEVERSLGDPDLSPSLVARRINVSNRYLHRLFADRGPSFGHWVRIRRLERCHRDLADPARAHWTIGDLACHHGFTDPSYFTRAFKAHYGITPRERRKEIH